MKKSDKFLIKKVTFILLLTVLLMLNNCESNTSTESEMQNKTTFNFKMDSLSVDEIFELIYGKWNWTYSIIMQRSILPPDNKTTPFSEGYTLRREFKLNKQVDNYTNDQYIDTRSYDINRYKLLDTDSGKVTVIYIDSTRYQLFFLNPDTMMIGNGWLDGVDDYYVRIN